MSASAMSDPSNGVSRDLLPHVHLISTFPYTKKARVDIPEVTNWLMQAPQIARDKAPFFWTYLDRPENGTITLTWQPLQQMGTAFASDGYIWGPQEQYFTQEVGNGVILEMYYHKAGFAYGENYATHSRRRFRLCPPNVHNPSTPQVDPSLWIVHYGPVDHNERIPAAVVPRDPRTSSILDTRAYLQKCGQIQRKEFILGDRVNWPQIAWPREPRQMYPSHRGVPQTMAYPPHSQTAGAPPSKRARTGQVAHGQVPAAMGAMPPSETPYDDEEDTSRGDLFDHLTPREISLIRYKQNHEWMEEILSSPYRMGQIGFTPLGFGLKGELASLTDGLFDSQGIDALTSPPKNGSAYIDPEKAAEFCKRVAKQNEDTTTEIAKMEADHTKKVARFKKNSLLMIAEKELRAAVDVAAPEALHLEGRVEEHEDGSASRWTAKHNRKVDEIVSHVEAQLGRRAEVIYNLKRIQDGGYQEPAPAPVHEVIANTNKADGQPNVATGSGTMSRQASQNSGLMLGGDSDVDMGGTAAGLLDQMHTQGLSSTSTPANNFPTPQGQLSAIPSNAATPVNLNVPSPQPQPQSTAQPAPPQAPRQDASHDVTMSGTNYSSSGGGTAPDQGTGSGEWVVVPKGGLIPDPVANPTPATATSAVAAPTATGVTNAAVESQQPNDNKASEQPSSKQPSTTGTPAASMGFDANDFGSLGDLDTAGDALAGFHDTPGDMGGSDFMEDSAFGDAFHGVEAGDTGTPADNM